MKSDKISLHKNHQNVLPPHLNVYNIKCCHCKWEKIYSVYIACCVVKWCNGQMAKTIAQSDTSRLDYTFIVQIK